MGGEELLKRVWRRLTISGRDGRSGEDCWVCVDELWHRDGMLTVHSGKIGERPLEIISIINYILVVPNSKGSSHRMNW